ncbi:magnesium transporter [Stratiformator vulcanicus]|uniref:Magnesium transporter MgtE n=1 Tax=Stratiformator vulcanicus TaxID=2527980 RepID=A0A517R3Z4_9PLAN|nr:magnesium transporter [Stratiformator vulcanicus]QDT38586.1 Magnesium transporter MgtE [Stratiformator vulcanicus]
MYHELLLPDIRQMIDEGDEAGLREFCDILHPAAAAEVLREMDPARVWQVLAFAPMETRVEIFEHLGLPHQVELVDEIDRDRLSKIIEAMSSDDRADLLGRMDDEQVEQLLPLVTKAERADIRRLLSYPEESAGSIMSTGYASLREETFVRDALLQLRSQAPKKETIYYIFVLDDGGRLEGIVTLRDLILAKPDKVVRDIMNRDVISVRVDEDQEHVAREVARYNFLAMPVVDNQNRLVGIVTHDDAMDIVREEADEDVQRMGAVEPLQDDYIDTGAATLAWKRGKWLLFLAVVALFTAEVLDRFEETSAKHVWAVLFLPLVLASGGNAGSQSATLVIRSLALSQDRRQNRLLGLLGRELIVGLILGGSLALLGFVVAATWFERPVLQALMVAMTVFLVVIFGTISGLVLPFATRRVGLDPALMSTPLITALVDIAGVLLYYGLALWLLDVLG